MSPGSAGDRPNRPGARSAGRGGAGRSAGADSGAAGAGRSTGPAVRPGPVVERRWRLVRAGTDAVPPSARRFMRRARQRRLRAALPWAAVGGVLVLAGLVGWIVYGTALFGVRELTVSGTGLTTPEQIREAAGVPHGIPLARVDLAAVRDRVGALAPVDQVTVSRRWPDTLAVRVVERTAAAVAPQGRGFVVLDGAGVVFRTVADRPADLPLARVPTPGPDDPATRAALRVLAALTPQLRAQLVEVVVRGPAEIRVELRGGRTVIWGDDRRSETKAQVATVLLGREGKIIDVSAPDVATTR